MPTKDPSVRQRNSRDYYLRNRDALLTKARLNNQRTDDAIRDYITDYLLAHPCVDCGEADPIVLEFDHRDPAEKEFSIGYGGGSRYSLGRVVREIAKCDVRCANCHRRKTCRENGSWRWKRFGGSQQDNFIGV